MALNKIKDEYKMQANIYAKLECFNPAGSLKDRIAFSMLNEALLAKEITWETTIIEATSGNTGIGLASVCASMGFKLILVMPESMSVERRILVSAYGAKIILTPASHGMRGAIGKAEDLLEEIPNSFMPSQFTNPANPLVHYRTTGPEIYSALDGEVDVLVAGISSGGSISGTGEYLREKNPDIIIYGVEPLSSDVLSGGIPHNHLIQGIGAGFFPETLNRDIYNEIIRVTEDEAYEATRQIAKTEGILVGISSGAAFAAVEKIDKKYPNKNIVVIFPDTGERYLSTGVFSAKPKKL